MEACGRLPLELVPVQPHELVGEFGFSAEVQRTLENTNNNITSLFLLCFRSIPDKKGRREIPTLFLSRGRCPSDPPYPNKLCWFERPSRPLSTQLGDAKL